MSDEIKTDVPESKIEPIPIDVKPESPHPDDMVKNLVATYSTAQLITIGINLLYNTLMMQHNSVNRIDHLLLDQHKLVEELKAEVKSIKESTKLQPLHRGV